MRKVVLFALAGVAIAATCIGVAWSAPVHRPNAAGRHEVHRSYYLTAGPTQECDFDACGNGIARQKLTLPDPGPYRLTITETFQYRTSGTPSFRTSLPIRHGATSVTPKQWALAPSTKKTTTSVTYRADVRNDRHYTLDPAASGINSKPGTWSITLSHVLITIDARPMPPKAIR